MKDRKILTTSLNETQELVFKLMEKATFNNFNGARVAQDLRVHRDLWESAFMLDEHMPLLALRDMKHNFYNADTLYILSSGKDDQKLEQLAKTWRPDSIEWIEGDDAMRLLGMYDKSKKIRILRLWWD